MRDRPARPAPKHGLAQHAARLLDRIEDLVFAVEDDVAATTEEQYHLAVRLLVGQRLAAAARDALDDPARRHLAPRLLAMASGHAALVEAGLRVLADAGLLASVRLAAHVSSA